MALAQEVFTLILGRIDDALNGLLDKVLSGQVARADAYHLKYDTLDDERLNLQVVDRVVSKLMKANFTVVPTWTEGRYSSLFISWN
jgi:hypothetical protein